jgi:hypothetical protein
MHKFTYFLGLIIAATLTACSLESADIGKAAEQSGSITRFAVHNGYMYALNPNQVKTYSLQNPDKPQLVHTLSTDYGLETIIVYDNTVYLGSRSALYILDISNPAAPQILSQTNRGEVFIGGCDPVVVKNNFAFSTIKIIENICGRVSAQSALLVYDVTDKRNPVQIGSYPLSLPNGLGYKDNFLFVCDEGTDRVEIYDITNPSNLELTRYAIPMTDPVDLIVRGDKLIVSAKTEFRFFDIRDMTNIQPLGRLAR